MSEEHVAHVTSNDTGGVFDEKNTVCALSTAVVPITLSQLPINTHHVHEMTDLILCLTRFKKNPKNCLASQMRMTLQSATSTSPKTIC